MFNFKRNCDTATLRLGHNTNLLIDCFGCTIVHKITNLFYKVMKDILNIEFQILEVFAKLGYISIIIW